MKDKNKKYTVYGVIGAVALISLFLMLIMSVSKLVRSARTVENVIAEDDESVTHSFINDIVNTEEFIVSTSSIYRNDSGNYVISINISNNTGIDYIVKPEQLYINGESSTSENQVIANSGIETTSEIILNTGESNLRTIKYKIGLYEKQSLKKQWVTGDTVLEYKDKVVKIYSTTQLNKIINDIEIVDRKPTIIIDTDDETKEDDKGGTYEQWAEQNGIIEDTTVKFNITDIGNEKSGYFQLPDKFTLDEYGTYLSPEGVKVRIDYFEDLGGVELTAVTAANFIDSGLETKYEKIYAKQEEIFVESESTYDYIVYIDCMYEITTQDKNEFIKIFTFTSPSDIKDSVLLSITFPVEYDVDVIGGYIEHIINSYKPR